MAAIFCFQNEILNVILLLSNSSARGMQNEVADKKRAVEYAEHWR